MTELISNYLHIIILYFPLGAIGMYRWSVWIIKKVLAKRYKPIAENGYSDTLSIVVPVYNEDENVFQRSLESWISNKPDEIIAIIDHTDVACIEKFKKFQEENKNSTLIITQRPGKREALSDGIKSAHSNIIALVDSDTIWDPNIKSALLFPFADPKVGAVGPRQDVLDTNTLARRLFNIHLDHRYFDEMIYLAAVSDALTCISGRTALYRKEAIKDLCDELENETFWGVKCISGDDKCLTRLVQERGWKVRYQANIRVRTPGAPDLLTLFKQQVRWTRNSYRSDLKSLMSKWIWKRNKFLAYHMIDRFTQPFTLIIGLIYFILSMIWGHWLISGILFVWWHGSRAIKLYPHLRHRPSDILILPFYIFTTFLMAILKIYAMVTIRQQGWITRWHKSRLQAGVDIRSTFRVLKLIVPYFATASIIILVSFGVVKYENVTAIPDYNGMVKSNGIKGLIISERSQPEVKMEKTLPYRGTFLSNRAWTSTAGASAMVEDGNMKIGTVGRTGALIFLNGTAAWKDYIFRAKIDWNKGSHVFLLSRIKGSKNYVACSFTVGNLRIEQYMGGKKKTLVKKDTFFEMPKKDLWLGMIVNKDKVECLVNGNSVIYTRDLSSELSHGGIGIKVFDPEMSNSEIILKDVEVVELADGGEDILAQLPKSELVIKEPSKDKAQKSAVATSTKKVKTVVPKPASIPISLVDEFGHSTPYTMNDLERAMSNWVSISGSYFVKDNFLHLVSGASTSAGRMVLDGTSDWSDYSFKTVVDWNEGTKLTLLARYKDSKNYMGCTFSHYGASATVYKVIDGEKTTLGKTPKMPVPSYTPWFDNNLSVQVKDDEIQCLINNQWVLRYKVTEMPKNGGIGIEISDTEPNSGEIILKEIRVELLGP